MEPRKFERQYTRQNKAAEPEECWRSSIGNLNLQSLYSQAMMRLHQLVLILKKLLLAISRIPIRLCSKRNIQ